jgi:hypothetical protein
MIAEHMIAKLRLDVTHEPRELLPGFPAPDLRGDADHAFDLRIVALDEPPCCAFGPHPRHQFIGMRVAPPFRRVQRKTQQEQSLGVACEHGCDRLLGVAIVGSGAGPCPRQPDIEAVQMDVLFRGQRKSAERAGPLRLPLRGGHRGGRATVLRAGRPVRPAEEHQRVVRTIIDQQRGHAIDEPDLGGTHRAGSGSGAGRQNRSQADEQGG